MKIETKRIARIAGSLALTGTFLLASIGAPLIAFAQSPTITDISPVSGPVAGGTFITITGTNFDNAAVTIGGSAVSSSTALASTSIIAMTPSGTAGTADVVVTNTDGSSATSTGGFTFEAASSSATTTSPLPTTLSLSTSTNADGSISGDLVDPLSTSTSANGVLTTLDIPAGITITGSSTWDGTLTLPFKTSSFTLTPSSGNTATAVAAVEIGAGDTPLSLSQPAKITFAGQSGKLAGFSRAGTFRAITNTCDSTTTPTLATSSDCVLNVAPDLVVWTNHFSQFIVYTEAAISTPTPAPAPILNRGGNGPPIGLLGGGSIVPSSAPVPMPTPTPAPSGQVLGATAFNFTTRLAVGSRGDAVTALQNLLTQLGNYSGPVTGFFGQLTEAAVKAFQAAHGIEQIGIVGPQTRAALNSTQGGSSMSDTARAQLLASLLQQLQQLMAKINALQAASSTSATTTSSVPMIPATSTPATSTPATSTTTATTTTTL